MPRGHYKRPSAEERFWAKVNRSDGCWEWTGHRAGAMGYGRLWLNGRGVPAHRFSYELHHGSISDGHLVLHRCDNPVCVRPDHLFTGTQLDNMRDKVAKGRQARSKHGAKLTGEAVAQYRERCAAGESPAVLAREAGVSPTTMHDLVTGKTWRDMPGPVATRPLRERWKTSRFNGVSYDHRSGKWSATTRRNGRKVYLGSFADESEAAAAAKSAREERYAV